MNKYKYDVSLILACYNEQEILTDSLAKIIRVLDKTDYTYEIILVDDQSQDETKSLIQKALRKYPRHNLSAYFHAVNQGRGQTVIDGFKKSQGKVIGFIDVDLEVAEWYLPQFISAIESGAEAAIARRIYDFNFRTIVRWLASKGYMWLRKRVLGINLKDTESGFKFFQRSKILPVLRRCHDPHWFWDTEIVARSLQAGLKFAEIPVVFIRRQDKTSTVKLLPDTLDYLKKLVQYRQELNVSA